MLLYIYIFKNEIVIFWKLVVFQKLKFGQKFSDHIEKEGAKWFTIVGVIIVIVVALIYFLFK